MKSRQLKFKIKDVPVYEHLDESLKKSYKQRLDWLEKARKFVQKVKKSKRK